MSYKLINLLNLNESMLFTILTKNLKEKYACFCKVRLSEFLYSMQPEGSKSFYEDFQSVNLITVPFAVVDVTTGQLSAVVFFNESGFKGKEVLDKMAIPCIGISEFKDVLISEILSGFLI